MRRLLKRCLEKDPRKRLSAIGDARLELDEPEPVTGVPASPARLFDRRSARVCGPRIAGVVLTAMVAALLWPRPIAIAPDGTVATRDPPAAWRELYPDSTGVAISPDGTMVAFVVGSVNQSISQLWVRSLDSSIARKLDDTEGALLPFWSPDSKRLGFLTSRKLKTIAVTGGRSETLTDAPNGRGATWNASNVILFAPEASGPIFRIPATGGTPETVTTLDTAKKGIRPPLSAVPARRRPLSLHVAAGQGGEVRHLRGLAQRQVTHVRRRARKLAGLRRSGLVALRSAGGAGRASL